MRQVPVGRVGTTLVALALVGVLAACQPIVVDGQGVQSSAASRAAEPVSVRVGGRNVPGVDIRMRDCDEAHLQQQGQDPIVIGLVPRATIVDAAGTVLYRSSDIPMVPPVTRPGAYEVGTADSPDGAHHTVVPLGGVAMPITIHMVCAGGYVVGSHGLNPRWIFPSCRTSTRRCNPTTPGTGEWRLSAG